MRNEAYHETAHERFEEWICVQEAHKAYAEPRHYAAYARSQRVKKSAVEKYAETCRNEEHRNIEHGNLVMANTFISFIEHALCILDGGLFGAKPAAERTISLYAVEHAVPALDAPDLCENLAVLRF